MVIWYIFWFLYLIYNQQAVTFGVRLEVTVPFNKKDRRYD